MFGGHFPRSGLAEVIYDLFPLPSSVICVSHMGVPTPQIGFAIAII